MSSGSALFRNNPVYVVDGNRTPFLKVRGKPGPFHASDLAVAAGRALLARQPFAPDKLGEVVLGCVSSGPDEANIARIVALRLGCSERMPAWTVQRNCASGMQAIDSAAKDIATGRAELVLAGGTESMSHHPVLFNPLMVAWFADWSRARSIGARARQLARLTGAHLKPVIGLLRGLTDPFLGLSMGQTAEQLAWRFAITREAMDAYAMRSHQRLAAATEKGRLEAEVVPVYDVEGRVHDHDDGLRPDTGMDQLAALNPVFDRTYGKVTAGNSAQVTDGAAMLLLASARAVDAHDLPVMGRIADVAWAGLDPAQMGLGPVHAMAPLLRHHGFDSADIDYWEINEAFAAQVLACLAAWSDEEFCRTELGMDKRFADIPEDRLNVDGGAVSIGHPVGASGARIVLHLLNVLERENARRGVASLCIGGGQGGAMLVERRLRG